ncbi:MAG TPA: ABC transporter substrate-binding protein, partial [Mycobacteriales bacterium]
PCLKKLVPIVQQASVDFMANPGPTNQLVISTVEKMKDFWTYSPGMADYAVKTLKSLGLVGNGPDKTLGNIQDSRVQRMIDILKPIYVTQHKEIKDGLKPSDIYTNEYINPNIGLTASSK